MSIDWELVYRLSESAYGDLQKENVSLKSQIVEANGVNGRVKTKVSELEAENVRLKIERKACANELTRVAHENAKLRDALHEILTYAQDADRRREIARIALDAPDGPADGDAELYERYEFCPDCRGSYSFAKPKNGRCPFCKNELEKGDTGG
jgi:regulator of replication initiation timing